MDSYIADDTSMLHLKTDGAFKKYKNFFRPAKYLVPVAIFALLMGSCDPDAPASEDLPEDTTEDPTEDPVEDPIDPATIIDVPSFAAPIELTISWSTSGGNYSIFHPALADMDDDGDLDIMTGYRYNVASSSYQRAVKFLKNTTSGDTLSFEEDNIFNNLVSTSGWASDFHGGMMVAVGDVDGQYDVDLVGATNFQQGFSISISNFTNLYMQSRNDAGTFDVSNEVMSESLDNYHVAPALADLDGDGDLDLVIGSSNVPTYSSSATPSGTKSIFYLPNPDLSLGNFDIGDKVVLFESSISNIRDWPIPSFADIDADGDQDMFVINYNSGDVTFYLNTGTAASPAFEAQASAFSVLPTDVKYFPAFGDMDGDTDLDVIAGTNDGKLWYIENTDIE